MIIATALVTLGVIGAMAGVFFQSWLIAALAVGCMCAGAAKGMSE